MPQAPSIPSGQSTKLLTVPAWAGGVVIWSTQAAPLYLRVNKPAAASGEDMGIYLEGGSAESPARVVFDLPDRVGSLAPHTVNVFQNSGSAITTGVGFEFFPE